MSHITEDMSEQLDAMFNLRWVKHIDSRNWAPKSPDLTPLNFHICRLLKRRVYRSTAESKVKNRVRKVFSELDSIEIKKVHRCYVLHLHK